MTSALENRSRQAERKLTRIACPMAEHKRAFIFIDGESAKRDLANEIESVA
ncbi:MAG: hypothetical protein K0Q83_368 [Deltaproteobacteria bacterium]|jgi:hypothetical protein|nr:hypothetical protein [Deltaproteobacteria bacterium]